MLEIVKAKGIRKYFGLMFRTRKTKALLFEFDKDVNYSIHSYFVFFKFKVIWYDENYHIIETRIVEPFQANIKPWKSYRRFVEIPL